MRELKALLWFGSKKLDPFMRAADLFGPYKILMESFDGMALTLTYKPGVHLKTSLAKSVRVMCPEMLLAMWVPDLPEASYRDRTVWEVSDGHRSCMFTDFLRFHGWKDPPLPFKIGGPEYKQALDKRGW